MVQDIKTGGNNFLLVGCNINALPFRYGALKYDDLPYEIKDPFSFIGGSPTYNSVGTAGIRSQLKIKLVPENSAEMGLSLSNSYYDKVSIMSLDGLISPVSFYPSPTASTFPMTSYTRSECPHCNGQGTTTKEWINPSLGSYPANITAISVDCPYCVVDAVKSDERKKTVSIGQEIEPPFIITSYPDNQTNTTASTVQIESSVVNKFTLNPVVMKNGEFSNQGGRQGGDNSAHCIDVVGAGLSSPDEGKSIRSIISKTDDNFISNYNQRFMGLRGPLMLHSWGYDIYGYPVPNKSGEFKLNGNNQIVTDNNGNNVYATQKQDSSYQSGWTPPVAEHKFRKGWAQLAHDWPVGPIDLRWDPNAGVWTMGSKYKDVWITIETDLTGKDVSVRGVIYDEGPTTLPAGKRKVVYVQDTVGIIVAPRKATLYCKYIASNGFYQPLYGTPLITTGTIKSDTSAEIDTKYSLDDTSGTYVASFSNPLSLDVTSGKKALFTYIDGSWTVSSIKDQ